MIVVRSWRITEAEPHGLMMWFDLTREVPLLGLHSPPSSEELEAVLEFDSPDGTLGRERVVPRKGPEDKTSASKDTDLPF